MTITRYAGNPVLSAKDVPYDATLVFNAGVAKIGGEYVMVFRNDWGDMQHMVGPRGINLGIARSRDGIKWTVGPKPIWELCTGEIVRIYDPRITVIEGKIYLCFAVDTRHGIRGGIASTPDFEHFEVISMTLPENRNMVLFPEKIGGKYARLERPFPIYGRHAPEAFDMWFSDSPDLAYWGNSNLVLGSEQVPWANCKIGPGAPPVRTPKGWLAVMHGVYKETDIVLKGWEKHPWRKRYMAGVVLLDLDEPWKVIGMSREPILAPEADYEVDGFRGSVIFPCGMILEDDGEVKIYYGAADTVVALATAHVDDLLRLCEPLA